MTKKLQFAGALLASSLLAAPAVAETLAVVGSWSNLPLHRQYEAPFWTEILPAASDGAQFVLDSRLEAGAGIYPPETAIPPDAYVDRLVDEPGFEFWSGRFEKRA